MRVTCPKCQFENQADSNRVVCARCATIIEVRPEAGVGGYDTYSTNFDDGSFGGGGYDNGARRTAGYQAPGYSGGGAADAGGYGANYPGSNYPTQNYSNASYPTTPVAHQSDQDVYATKIDDDFDDVLDIPRTTVQQPQSYQPNEAAPVFEDVFATPDYGMGGNQRNAPDQYQMGMGGMPGANDPYQGNDPYAGGGQQYRGGHMPEANFDNPSYGVPPEPEFMGWPVLPEDSTDPGIPTTSGFAKKNSLFRTVLIVAAALGLLFIAYSLFSGPVTRKPTPKPADTDTASTSTTGEQSKADDSAKGDIAAVTKSDKNAAEKPPVGPSGTETKPPVTQPKSEKVTVPPVTVTTPAPKVLPPETTTVKKPEVKKPEAAKPETAKQPENAGVPPTPNRGGITLQVGSFNDRAQADERVSRLKAAGVEAHIVSANIPGRGLWHRVQVGRFVSREQAAGYASQLRGRGLVQDFMVTPVN
ncbi:MAG: SPOR domain-containing protein [Acidobacteria bacterium]|nr:SPOR domain-containing protein [Acidobacteriota bacterium]MBI3427990.1 SPOR domain-containing protein [Acidobacteriota bacterium]